LGPIRGTGVGEAVAEGEAVAVARRCEHIGDVLARERRKSRCRRLLVMPWGEDVHGMRLRVPHDQVQ
jgi:hypothetical protein